MGPQSCPCAREEQPMASVLDELKDVEERIVARMRELLPSVNEFEQLQRAAQRLGVNIDAALGGAAPADSAASAPATDASATNSSPGAPPVGGRAVKAPRTGKPTPAKV